MPDGSPPAALAWSWEQPSDLAFSWDAASCIGHPIEALQKPCLAVRMTPCPDPPPPGFEQHQGSVSGCSVVDRRVGRGPEVETDIRGIGGGPGPLGHQDRDHVLPRIRVPRGAQAAVPAERSDAPRNVIAA